MLGHLIRNCVCLFDHGDEPQSCTLFHHGRDAFHTVVWLWQPWCSPLIQQFFLTVAKTSSSDLLLRLPSANHVMSLCNGSSQHSNKCCLMALSLPVRLVRQTWAAYWPIWPVRNQGDILSYTVSNTSLEAQWEACVAKWIRYWKGYPE